MVKRRSKEDHVVLRSVQATDDSLSRVFPRYSDERRAPLDRRVSEVRRLDQAYDLPVYRSLDEWRLRAATLRRHVLVSTGLWPLPKRTPLNPVVFGRIERGDYSVEKVFFESRPGFVVTGNLYRPRGLPGPHPGILNPHGHWDRGRLSHDQDVSAPARCISFARQGYVAFTYDMVGYVDSVQLPHTFGGPREDLWGINLMGLQLWNSLRALDFLTSLPDVDDQRLGCTGESGGGTQTFMLAAVDDRVAVAAPVNMVSAHFQGGCLCENAPGLRLDTTNVELAALMAPRPMLLVSATGDWTCNTPAIEYPAIKAVYGLFDAADRVASVQIDAGHNYNQASREAVYDFFGRWLLEAPHDIDWHEYPLGVEVDDDLRVWAGTTIPSSLLTADGLTAQLIAEARDRLDRCWPRTAADLPSFQAIYGSALQHVLAVTWSDEVAVDAVATAERDGFTVDWLILGRPGQGVQLPAVLFRPSGWTGRHAALAVHTAGKAALMDGSGQRPGALVRELLGAGHAVLAVDLFLTGEYHTYAGRSGRNHGIAYFTAYNRTDTAERVQDILTALAYLQGQAHTITMVGLGDGGAWCLLARTVTPRPALVVADAAGFDLHDDTAYLERLYIPGLLRAGGLPTALALTAPAPTFIHNTAGVFPVDDVQRLYGRLGQSDALRVQDVEAGPRAIVKWLCGRCGIPTSDAP